MQTKTYSDLYNLVTALSGVGSFTTNEKLNILQFVNRRAFEAYRTSPSWPRYLVIGEERTLGADGLVPYAQTGLDTISDFQRIYRSQPFLRNSVLEYEFYVDSNGAHILNIVTTDSTSAFVNYQKELPTFTEESKDIPYEFFFYLAHAAYADFLRMDGQTDKAMTEEQVAGTYLALELEKIDLRSNNNTINQKFSTYVNRQSRQHLCYNTIMSSSRNNTLEFSSVGSEILQAADAVTGKRFGALQIINDAVFSVLTASTVEGSAKLVGPTIPAGTVIYGVFSEVTVASGLVAAHKYQYAPKLKKQSR